MTKLTPRSSSSSRANRATVRSTTRTSAPTEFILATAPRRCSCSWSSNVSNEESLGAALARWYSNAPHRRTTRTFPSRTEGIRLCATFLANISPHIVTTPHWSTRPPGIFLHRTYAPGCIQPPGEFGQNLANRRRGATTAAAIVASPATRGVHASTSEASNAPFASRRTSAALDASTVDASGPPFRSSSRDSSPRSDSSRRFVLGLGRVHSVGSRSASRTARLARSDTTGGRRPRRARRPPRARHGDGGDGGGDGGDDGAKAGGGIDSSSRSESAAGASATLRAFPSPSSSSSSSSSSDSEDGTASRSVLRRAGCRCRAADPRSCAAGLGAWCGARQPRSTSAPAFPSSGRSGAAFAGESARDDDEPPTLSPPSPAGAGAGVEAPFSAESSPRRDSKQKSHTLDGSTPSSRMSTSERGRWSERELHAPQNTLPHARQWCLNPGSDPGNSRSHP